MLYLGIGIVGVVSALFVPIGVFIAMLVVSASLGVGLALFYGGSVAHALIDGILCLICAQIGYGVGLVSRAEVARRSVESSRRKREASKPQTVSDPGLLKPTNQK
jgi:hypothetical protein